MVAEKGIAGMSRDAFATVARRLCDIRATRCDRFATFARCLCDGRATSLRRSSGAQCSNMYIHHYYMEHNAVLLNMYMEHSILTVLNHVTVTPPRACVHEPGKS